MSIIFYYWPHKRPQKKKTYWLNKTKFVRPTGIQSQTNEKQQTNTTLTNF